MGINTAVRNAYFNNVVKNEMTVEEFKSWLKKFGKNESDPISEYQLQQAIRATTGGWFSKWKAKRALKEAGPNNKGCIEDHDIMKLKNFAQKELGIDIITN
ncbi:calcium-binding protein 5-like [Forsythia ovata]|uniref:Calcium-binding protein 5-like n=1 Tax=Forsythia ovata TaxID=205694 RepID=A0ABD1P4Y8_9LAMI